MQSYMYIYCISEYGYHYIILYICYAFITSETHITDSSGYSRIPNQLRQVEIPVKNTSVFFGCWRYIWWMPCLGEAALAGSGRRKIVGLINVALKDLSGLKCQLSQNIRAMINQIWLVVEPYPSEKWWSSSVGRMTFPIYGKISHMFQSTNQVWL